MQITVADNANGTGIGGATPGSSSAPGSFLTGQWQNITLYTLGVTSLNPGEAGAIFKGANSQSQALNDNGVFEGLTDEVVPLDLPSGVTMGIRLVSWSR